MLGDEGRRRWTNGTDDLHLISFVRIVSAFRQPTDHFSERLTIMPISGTTPASSLPITLTTLLYQLLALPDISLIKDECMKAHRSVPLWSAYDARYDPALVLVASSSALREWGPRETGRERLAREQDPGR